MSATDADPVIPQLHFSTAALARRDAAEVWHERVAGYYKTLPVASGAEPFRIRTASWNLGEQLTVHARYSSREQARTPRKIRADQVDHYRLIPQQHAGAAARAAHRGRARRGDPDASARAAGVARQLDRRRLSNGSAAGVGGALTLPRVKLDFHEVNSRGKTPWMR